MTLTIKLSSKLLRVCSFDATHIYLKRQWLFKSSRFRFQGVTKSKSVAKHLTKSWNLGRISWNFSLMYYYYTFNSFSWVGIFESWTLSTHSSLFFIWKASIHSPSPVKDWPAIDQREHLVAQGFDWKSFIRYADYISHYPTVKYGENLNEFIIKITSTDYNLENVLVALSGVSGVSLGSPSQLICSKKQRNFGHHISFSNLISWTWWFCDWIWCLANWNRRLCAGRMYQRIHLQLTCSLQIWNTARSSSGIKIQFEI